MQHENLGFGFRFSSSNTPAPLFKLLPRELSLWSQRFAAVLPLFSIFERQDRQVLLPPTYVYNPRTEHLRAVSYSYPGRLS